MPLWDDTKTIVRLNARIRELESERDAIEAATIERCTQICDGWLERFGDGEIKYTRPTEYASDAVKDIKEAIRALKPTAPGEA